MKAELLAAIAPLSALSRIAVRDGLSELQASAQSAIEGISVALLKAELMEELWAAAKEVNAARIEWGAYCANERGSGSDVFKRIGAANLRMEQLCRKVADTDGQ